MIQKGIKKHSIPKNQRIHETLTFENLLNQFSQTIPKNLKYFFETSRSIKGKESKRSPKSSYSKTYLRPPVRYHKELPQTFCNL